MKVSAYIAALTELMKEHGDLDVETTSINGERVSASFPRIGHVRILKGRERTARFWGNWDARELKGNKVIEI